MKFLRRIVQGIIKFFILIYTKLDGKYKFVKNDIKVPKEPVLFLSNHQLNLDAVRLRMYNNRRILFVGHEEVFRNKLYRWIANNLMDIICRGYSKTDISYIKDLFRAKKAGLSIGIYPEGGINYFNKSIHFDISIAKLAKKLNMPIMLCNVNGGSFIKPRWSKHKGKNRVEFSYKRLITKEELKNLSVEELYQIMIDNIIVNDYDWQRKTMSAVNRKEPARNLNHALFVCPKCSSIHTLNFSDNTISCSHCKKIFGIDKYNFVINSNKVKDLVAWDELQYKILKEKLKNFSKDKVLLEAKAEYKTTHIDEYFNRKDHRSANVKLYMDRLVISLPDKEIIYPINNLYKIYVEFRNTIQFSFEENKIRLEGQNLPAYVWVTYLRCLSNTEG